MRRYWVKFDLRIDDAPLGVAIGCGVTADDIKEAMLLLKQKVFNDKELPTVLNLIV